jgi:hypothetical protein
MAKNNYVNKINQLWLSCLGPAVYLLSMSLELFGFALYGL